MIITLPIAASADDTSLHQWSTAYGGSDGAQDNDLVSAVVFPRNDQPAFGGSSTFSRGPCVLRFDTSGIPDNALVTAATLEIKSDSLADVDNRNLLIEWLPAPGEITFAQYWTATPSGTAKAATDLTTLAAATLYSWALLNPNDYVNRNGFTGLRFHIDGASPTGNNRIIFHAFDSATEPEPKLLVTYEDLSLTFADMPKPLAGGRVPVA